MGYKLLILLNVLVQNVICTVYSDVVFEYKKNRVISNIIIYISLNLLFLATTPIINLKVLKLIIILILQTLLFKLVSKDSMKSCLKKCIILIALALLTEFTVDYIYYFISKINGTRLDIDTASTFDTLRVLSSTLMFPGYMGIVLVYASYYKKFDKSIRRKIIVLFIILDILFIFFHFILYSYNIETFTFTTLLFVVVMGILSMIIMITCYYLILDVERLAKKESELEFLKQKQYLQLDYYKVMQEKEEEIRKINHDIKNNIQIVYALKDGKNKEKLIKQINSDFKKIELIKYSKNDIQNIILNTKVAEAKRKNIDITVDLKANIDFLDELDMSNLLSNILNNAINAASESHDKKIDFYIYKKMNYCVIKCVNTYNGNINTNKYGDVITSRDKNHGYGLKIIDSVAKKYDGEKKIYYDNNQFTMIVLVQRQEQ